MIQLEHMPHGVFWARLVGKTSQVLAVRCDPWEAMRVATKRTREQQAKSREKRGRMAGLFAGRYIIQSAKRLRPDPYAYLNATDEEIGHIAHIEEGAD